MTMVGGLYGAENNVWVSVDCYSPKTSRGVRTCYGSAKYAVGVSR